MTLLTIWGQHQTYNLSNYLFIKKRFLLHNEQKKSVANLNLWNYLWSMWEKVSGIFFWSFHKVKGAEILMKFPSHFFALLCS